MCTAHTSPSHLIPHYTHTSPSHLIPHYTLTPHHPTSYLTTPSHLTIPPHTSLHPHTSPSHLIPHYTLTPHHPTSYLTPPTPYCPTPCHQVGRSADQCINYVVVETEVTREGREQYKANSTVSRYACRILCERKPPYTARIYAAAFDTNNKIKLSVSSWHVFTTHPPHRCEPLVGSAL